MPKRFVSALCVAALMILTAWADTAQASGSQPTLRFLTLSTRLNVTALAEAAELVPANLRALTLLKAEGTAAANAILELLPKGVEAQPIWGARGVLVRLSDSQVESLGQTTTGIVVEDCPEILPSSPTCEAVSRPDIESIKPPSVPWNLAQCGAYALRTVRNLTGKGVMVGVLGYDLSHSHISLLGRIVHFRKFAPGPGRTTQSTDDLLLIHPLGILAGTHPNQLLGVAPDVELALATVQRGSTSVPNIMNAIQWLMEPSPERKPAVLFLAVDFIGQAPRPLRELLNSCRTAGILPVAAAGNNPDRISGMAALPEVVTIAALDQWKNRAPFSGQGPVIVDGASLNKPDFSEPGLSVFGPSYENGAFRYGSGTLQSAAHFVGIWALMKEARPNEELASMLSALATTSSDIGPSGIDPQTGMGLADPSAALYALENPPPPATYSLRVPGRKD